MNPWILASRPKTLSASVAPVLIGTGLALRENYPIPWLYFFLVLAGAIAIQIGTNMINDALDFKKGADTSARLGPVRVTQAGLLNAEAVLRGGTIALAVGALAGIPLVYRAGWPLLAIGIASILSAYLYTGGPYPLAYHGLGEVFVMIFFGFFAVGGTYYVLTLQHRAATAVGGFIAGSLAIVILAINNLRDIPNDRASNKNTVAVRLGARGARLEIAAFAIAPYLALAGLAWWLRDGSLLLAALTLPLALILLRSVYRSDGAALNRCLAMSGALQWAFGTLFLLGCLF